MKTSDVINKLRGLDLSAYPFNEVLSLINCFDSIKFIRVKVSPGAIITRVRKGWGYHSRFEVSYPPVELCKQCQRATLPNNTMFYGTISDSKDSIIDNRAIAISECSKLARQGKETYGEEEFTVSDWLLNKEIQLATIVDDFAFCEVKNNNMLKYAQDKFKEFKLLPDFDEYARFVAEEFSKPVEHNYEYLISASIADAYVNKTGLDGIMYPSVRIGGQLGMNIALKSQVSDNSLRILNVSEVTYRKNGADSYVIINKLADMETWNYFDYPIQIK